MREWLGRLGMGGGAVEVAGVNELAEERAGLETGRRSSVFVLDDDVGGGDGGGQQVGRELATGERQVEHPPETAHETGLADAGPALEEDVAARNNCTDHVAYDFLLTDAVLCKFFLYLCHPLADGLYPLYALLAHSPLYPSTPNLLLRSHMLFFLFFF